MGSPEWECWEAAEKTEIGGLVSKRLWTQCPSPKGNIVLGTSRLYNRKIGERGEVVKHKCRLVAQGFRRIKGLHYDESTSPAPAAASTHIALATAAVMDMELRHIDFEQAYLLADVDTEICIELPGEYREFPDAVGILNKAIYGLVQAGTCWNMRLTNDLKTLGFEQLHVSPCAFRTFVAGKMEAILVVHVDDLLALTVTKEAMETFVRELRSMLKIKYLGEAPYYMGCHITRDWSKKKLKSNQYLYVRTITERFGIGKTAMVPATAGGKSLSKEHGSKTPEEKGKMTKIPYREAVVGALM